MCKTCGEENADRKVSFNIAYRALGYISKAGVTVNRQEYNDDKRNSKEATGL